VPAEGVRRSPPFSVFRACRPANRYPMYTLRGEVRVNVIQSGFSTLAPAAQEPTDRCLGLTEFIPQCVHEHIAKLML